MIYAFIFGVLVGVVGPLLVWLLHPKQPKDLILRPFYND